MLDFKDGSDDTGYNNSESIDPYDNAEDANQTVLRRPPENLRKRHEVIRRAFDHQEAVCGSDRGLQMMCDPDVCVTWNGISGGAGDGKFSIPTGEELRIVPIISTAGEGAGSATLAQLRFEPDPIGHTDEYFRARSDLKAYEGGNNIFFELVAGGSLTITVEGSKDNGNYDPAFGSVAIRVTYVVDTTTWSDLVTALNADGDANTLMTAWNHASLAAVVIAAGDAITYQRLSDGTGTDVVGYGGIDAEGFVLTAAQIVTFFGVAGNPLDEGDTLVLDFVDAATRRAQVESDDVSGALQVVRYGGAAIATDDPLTGTVGNLHSVPICKAFNGNLHFMNGTVVKKDETVPLTGQNPTFIVGPGGSVQAAIDALAATGGTVFIKSGIYTENLDLADIDYDITLIGEGVDKEATSKGVVLINSGADHNITVAAGISARVVFENLRVEQDNAAGMFLYADSESTLERARVTFSDCVFLHTTATAISPALFDHSINLEFFDCYFEGKQDGSSYNMATVFRPYAKTTAGITQLRVERCYFEKFAEIAEIGKVGTQNDVGSFIFCDNMIYDCGRTTGVAAVGRLILAITDKFAYMDISRIRWKDGEANTASGRFCYVRGEGIIANNVLKRGVLGFTPTTQASTITVVGVSTFRICGNYVPSLKIKTDGIEIGATVEKTIVEGNIITAIDDDTTSIVGIKVGGTECVISGNTIEGTFNGIKLTVGAANGDNVIANNVIKIGSGGSSHGIEVDANCHGNTLIGNVIRGGGGISCFGIDLNASDNVAIIGNKFSACDTNIENANSADCGVLGGQATATLAVTVGNVQADDTVTVDSVVYTFKAVPAADGEVDIGASAAISIANLIAAINCDDGEATKYGAGMTLHPTVTATSVSGSDAIKVITKLPGGDDIVVSRTFAVATGDWDHSPLEYEEYTLAHNWW